MAFECGQSRPITAQLAIETTESFRWRIRLIPLERDCVGDEDRFERVRARIHQLRIAQFQTKESTSAPFDCSADFHFVLPSFSLKSYQCNRAILNEIDLTGFQWVLPGFRGFSWVLLGFSVFHWMFVSFCGFYWVLVDFTGF